MIFAFCSLPWEIIAEFQQSASLLGKQWAAETFP